MKLNIGNSVFKGFNDKDGIMICGYEWGFSKEDQKRADSNEMTSYNQDAETTFSNKTPSFGDTSLTWPYDIRVIKWFDLWGHPLSRENLGGDFEKCIIQTNWCNTQSYKIKGSYFKKLTDEEQLNNFIYHIKSLKPKIIFLMGSQMINILQNPIVLNRFSEVMGQRSGSPKINQKPYHGISFKVGFQDFEQCTVISLPHPSSARGLSYEYISMFSDEIGKILTNYKVERGISVI